MKKFTRERIVQLSLIALILILFIVLFIINRDSLIDKIKTNFFEAKRIKSIGTGLLNTTIISISGFVIGLFLGLLTCLVQGLHSENVIVLAIKQVFNAYVKIFRGTPTVVQLLIIYYIVFSTYSGPAIIIGIVAFGLNSGAYISEIMRGGINSVPQGQMEAGRSLGLPYSNVMTRVIFPQAIKNSLPSLGNEFITLIKETSIVGFITSIDLTLAFRKIANATYDYATVYIVMGVVYFLIVLLVTKLLGILERRLNRNAR